MKRLLALCLMAPLAVCDLIEEALDSFDTSISGTIFYDGDTPSDVEFTLYSVTDNLDAFDIEYCYDLEGEVVYADSMAASSFASSPTHLKSAQSTSSERQLHTLRHLTGPRLHPVGRAPTPTWSAQRASPVSNKTQRS